MLKNIIFAIISIPTVIYVLGLIQINIIDDTKYQVLVSQSQHQPLEIILIMGLLLSIKIVVATAFIVAIYSLSTMLNFTRKD